MKLRICILFQFNSPIRSWDIEILEFYNFNFFDVIMPEPEARNIPWITWEYRSEQFSFWHACLLSSYIRASQIEFGARSCAWNYRNSKIAINKSPTYFGLIWHWLNMFYLNISCLCFMLNGSWVFFVLTGCIFLHWIGYL